MKEYTVQLLILKFIIILLLSISLYGQEGNFKKIIVEESNNNVLNNNYKNMDLPKTITNPELINLRNYVLSNIDVDKISRIDVHTCIKLMNWVSKQWKHNGWNEAHDSLTSLDILKNAKKLGYEYRCTEYGKVLQDVLISFGYIARTISLKHVDADYGGAGMGHVAIEIWSNSLKKWIFLDPQFNIYAKHNDNYLNFFDIYMLKKNNLHKEIQFIENEHEINNNYFDFIKNYMGYLDIRQKKMDMKYRLVLKLDGKKEFYVYQGFPFGNLVFTDNKNDIYFPVNQVMGILNYSKNEYERADTEYAKLEIKTISDFNKNMIFFAAKPDYELLLENNMPWFKRYVVKVNGEIITIVNQKYTFRLNDGLNIIQITAFNEQEVEGISTIIKIRYE